ncbi:MAG TPA: DUF1990 domain-containing protein [Actinospica sp.]|jgi:uncharacterized protein (UPF0548 family)|nr:DUF1990 domain-containing protein [Actinospica sp.]
MGTLTYQEVGATRPGEPLPGGYRHLDRRMRVGSGQAAFEAAGEAVVTFRMHAQMHLKPQASAKRAEPGTFVVLRVGPERLVLLRAPCEVVWAIDEPRRRGFGYGTLPRHPERGEEGFFVDRDEADAVWLTVRAFSAGARWYTRAAGPLVPLFQRGYALYCGAVLRRIVRGASV